MSTIGKIIKSFSPAKLKNRKYEKVSYAQSGEDLIIDFIFNQLKIDKPSFLDIGAHHPQYLSNTYFFYAKGCRGVNIEPDPFLIEKFHEERRDDINLNVGIGFNNDVESADFYIMTTKTLNTFSKEDALNTQSYGSQKIEQVIKVDLVPINNIMQDHFLEVPVNLISLDVEGLDFEIIKSFDFEQHRPQVLCIETLTYTEDKTEKKLNHLIDYVLSKGYFVYADTYINTVFVDSEAWKNR